MPALGHGDELPQGRRRHRPGGDLVEQALGLVEQLRVGSSPFPDVATTHPDENQSTVSKASPLTIRPLSSESVMRESGRFALLTTMPRIRSNTPSCSASPTVSAAARSESRSSAVGMTIRSATDMGPSSDGS